MINAFRKNNNYYSAKSQELFTSVILSFLNLSTGKNPSLPKGTSGFYPVGKFLLVSFTLSQTIFKTLHTWFWAVFYTG